MKWVSVGCVTLTALMWVAGCGQKGALYLPKRGTVVTRPAGTAAPVGKKPDDKDKDSTSQPPQ